VANKPALASERWIDSSAAIWIAWGLVVLLYAGMLLHANLVPTI
jgi:hypothetical protein